MMNITQIIGKLSTLKKLPILPILVNEHVKVYTLFFKPTIFMKMQEFIQSVKKLDHVTCKFHRYGGLEFNINQREFCHIHGDGMIDIILTNALAIKYFREGICMPHHFLKKSPWVSYQITNVSDITEAVQLAQVAYQLKLN